MKPISRPEAELALTRIGYTPYNEDNPIKSFWIHKTAGRFCVISYVDYNESEALAQSVHIEFKRASNGRVTCRWEHENIQHYNLPNQ